jgi:hypothetical protein
MAPAGSKVQQFILHALVPIICSIVVGYIFYQDGVFNRSHGSFQFLWSAVVASVFYYLLVYLRPRDAYLGLLILFLLTLVTTESTRPAYILRDIFYVAAIGASVFIYFRYFRKGADINYAYSGVILAGIYGLVYGVATVMLLAVQQAFAMESTGGVIDMNMISTTAGFGLWIGFAVGAGITLADKLFSMRRHKVVHDT